jgi:dTDP-4-dehydrorhamnose 3,5-epimerase
MKVALTGEASQVLSFEDYSPQPEIAGVWQQPLRKLRSENGWFMELARVTDSRLENLPTALELRQASLSYAAPERINAFHLHPKVEQNEVWSVVQGQLLVWLVDCRAGSPTAGVRRKVILSGEQPVQLFIPAGVAHGYKAGPEGALLVYLMDQQFNLADPNEGRLPWDHYGSDLWQDNRG